MTEEHRLTPDEIKDKILLAKNRFILEGKILKSLIVVEFKRDLHLTETEIKAGIELVEIELDRIHNTPPPKTVVKESEVPKEQKEKAIEELKDPNLIANIVEEVQKEGVIGNEDTIMVCVSKLALNKVKDPEPTSKTITLRGKPDAGKDKTAACVFEVVKTNHSYVNDFSEKCLQYWKDKDWTNDGLHLEDPEEKTLKSSGFKAWITGKGKFVTLIDQVTTELQIRGQPVIIITSAKDEVTDEGDRRIDFKGVENTPKLTEAVVQEWRKKQSGIKIEEKPKNKALRYGLNNLLQKYDVVIPELTREAFKELFVGIKGKSNVKRHVDYIKGIASLHQHQRNKDSEGRLIATVFDIILGTYLYYLTRSEGGLSLSERERTLVTFLSGKGAVEISVVESGTGIAKSTIYANKQAWLDKGIIAITTVSKLCGEFVKDVEALMTPISLTDDSIFYDFSSIFYGFEKNVSNRVESSSIVEYITDFLKLVTKLNAGREKYGLDPILSRPDSRPDARKSGKSGKSCEIILEEYLQERKKPENRGSV